MTELMFTAVIIGIICLLISDHRRRKAYREYQKRHQFTESSRRSFSERRASRTRDIGSDGYPYPVFVHDPPHTEHSWNTETPDTPCDVDSPPSCDGGDFGGGDGGDCGGGEGD